VTILFHPDYTVGPGVSPDLLTQAFRKKRKALAGYTAGGELHPALRTQNGYGFLPPKARPDHAWLLCNAKLIRPDDA